MAFIILLVIAGMIGGFLLFRPIPDLKPKRKLKPGDKLTNKKGKHWKVNDDGFLVMGETLGEFVNHPKVKKQLDAFQRMYMQQTLKALYDGTEPPNSVGGYGILTKKKLKLVWNDEWQAELDNMNEYYDVTYNSFFDIPEKRTLAGIVLTDIPEEYPPVSIVLTAEEILAEYGSEKES